MSRVTQLSRLRGASQLGCEARTVSKSVMIHIEGNARGVLRYVVINVRGSVFVLQIYSQTADHTTYIPRPSCVTADSHTVQDI